MKLFFVIVAPVVLAAAPCEAFAPHAVHRSRAVVVRDRGSGTSTGTPLWLSAAPPPPPPSSSDDFPPEEQTSEYTGSVDWDAEWKKVVKSGVTVEKDRPGKGYYKSEAEIAAIRAANKATEQVNKVATIIPSIPSWNELKGDWRFWIGVLAVISVGTSLLAAAGSPPPMPTNSSPDSFFI